MGTCAKSRGVLRTFVGNTPTTRIVDFHAWLRVHDARHDEADFLWRIELARAGHAAFGEFANEILVTASDDVRLNVIETEALFADALDEIGKTVVGQIAARRGSWR